MVRRTGSDEKIGKDGKRERNTGKFEKDENNLGVENQMTRRLDGRNMKPKSNRHMVMV